MYIHLVYYIKYIVFMHNCIHNATNNSHSILFNWMLYKTLLLRSWTEQLDWAVVQGHLTVKIGFVCECVTLYMTQFPLGSLSTTLNNLFVNTLRCCTHSYRHLNRWASGGKISVLVCTVILRGTHTHSNTELALFQPMVWDDSYFLSGNNITRRWFLNIQRQSLRDRIKGRQRERERIWKIWVLIEFESWLFSLM